MKLSEKRVIFTSCLAALLSFARAHDFYVAIDDAKAHDGHMKNSLHYEGLAVDLILYDSDYKYLTQNKNYEPLGLYWESLHSNCFWGGRTRRDENGTDLSNDGNHFSMSWDNRR